MSDDLRPVAIPLNRGGSGSLGLGDVLSVLTTAVPWGMAWTTMKNAMHPSIMRTLNTAMVSSLTFLL